jgi:hypothetical protein
MGASQSLPSARSVSNLDHDRRRCAQSRASLCDLTAHSRGPQDSEVVGCELGEPPSVPECAVDGRELPTGGTPFPCGPLDSHRAGTRRDLLDAFGGTSR